MFDMLDDDNDLGYIPTAPGTKSRAGSMKKLTKKEPKAPKTTKNPPNKLNQFDDLLDDILETETKALGMTENKSFTKQAMTKKDSFDSYFDEAKPKSPKKAENPPPAESKFSSFGKKASVLEHSDEIISEDLAFGKNKPKVSTTVPSYLNLSKEENNDDLPVFTSSRNMMKPPLKKKESQGSLKLPPSNSPSLPEEVNLTLSSNKNEEDIVKPPSRLTGKRLSVEGKSQKNEGNAKPASQSLSLTPEERKEDRFGRGNQGLFLTLEEPKVAKKEEVKNSFELAKEAPERVPSKELKLFERESKSLEKPRQELRLAPPPRVALEMKIDQSVTWKEPPSVSTAKEGPPTAGQDYERQIEHVRQTFQKQIEFMEENLEKQIAANRQTREKVMQESNRMIEEERSRSQKMFEEELARQKSMFEWEKKRLQDHYQAEIAALKQSVEFANRNSQISNLAQSRTTREDSSYLETQLKNQKKILEDRERIIDKREADLDQREQDLAKRRKREEERLREEEKRLLELEMRLKKQSMEEKKALGEEKQQMAIELANLELEAMRRKEKADFSLKENRLVKQSIDNQRTELRMANAELMSKYRGKCAQLEQERERIQSIEQELAKKLRVVELKNREVSEVNRTMCQKKENNWVAESRPVSVGRRTEKPGTQTKQRFWELENKTKDRLNISVRESGHKFDLDRYMLAVSNYNKLKVHS